MLRSWFLRMRWVCAICLGLLIAACATETIRPTFPTASGLVRPDRVLVGDFAVTPEESALKGVVGSGLESRVPQSEEEIRVGRALGKALSENLVAELRARGIDARAAGQTAAREDNTALIRGRFLRGGPGSESAVGFALGSREVRARIQIFQGKGLDVRLVSEAESVTPSSLAPGSVASGAIEATAKRAAQNLAERVADYYRKQGWLQ
jgi:hypothetical protein